MSVPASPSLEERSPSLLPPVLSTLQASLLDWEARTLHALAAKSLDSKGRKEPAEPCPLRTAFQRDRDRIIHSKAFRRLKHKTQVFISPLGDHFRTRLTHTLEVAQVARTIARALRLNEDLTEAVALGHDLGHPPFGHTGEAVLNKLSTLGFQHETQSLRIVTVLEPLNLTYETLDALEKQGGKEVPTTLEGQVVKLADRFAYLHHDIEDAIRAGVVSNEGIPKEIRGVLGETRQERLNTMVFSLIAESADRMSQAGKNTSANEPVIALPEAVFKAVMALRTWMFENVYYSAGQTRQREKVTFLLEGLYQHLMMSPDAIPEGFPRGESLEQTVLDYVAGMTDRFATDLYIRERLPARQQSADFWERG